MKERRALVPVALAVTALVGILVFFAGRNRREAPKPVDRLTAQSFALKNGLSADLVSGACGNDVSVVVSFEVGMDHDPKGRAGMAHVVRHLLSVAPAERVRRAVETGASFTEVSFTVPGGGLEAELDRLASDLARFSVTQTDLDAARAKVLQELDARHGGDAMLTAIGFAAESVQASRGKGWLGGVAEEVKAIEPAEVQTYLDAHFRPKNARLVVVGSFDPKAVRARIDKDFSPLPPGTAAPLRDPVGTTVTGTLVMGEAPTAVALAVAAPAPTDALYPGFLVLAARLSDGTFASKVSYDAFLRPETLLVTSPLGQAERPDPAAARVRSDLAKRLEQRLTPRDIELAKARFERVLGLHELEPAACQKDPLGLAVARARRSSMRLDSTAVAKAVDRLTQGQLDDARALFAPARTAAVAAGGAIR